MLSLASCLFPIIRVQSQHLISYLYIEGTSTVQRMLTFVACLTHCVLRSLHHRFVAWTKPNTTSLTPRISPETVSLIREMARDNRLWGAERIRGELLKLGIRVCKRTIQKYMRQVRTTRPRGQTWSTFLQAHAQQIWACDASPSD